MQELLAVSFPLMISLLASYLMMFFDRCFLAYYSHDALNACNNAGIFAWAILVGFATLCGIAEVFVAQYNGANRQNEIGEPVWQMIWLALLSAIVCIPIGIFGKDWLFVGTRYETMASEYFMWLMLFSPFPSLFAAVTSFYVGRGKIFLITGLSVVANLINIALDYVLIFGVEGVCPPLGIRGAAIATCAGEALLSCALLLLFLRKNNAEKYGTRRWRIKTKSFMRYIKVGLPQALAMVMEVLGWAFFYRMLTALGEVHITVSSICQSFVLLFFFFLEGVSRGVTVVAGNLIGAKKHNLVNNVMWSGIKLHAIFFLFLIMFFIASPGILMKNFMGDIASDATLMSQIDQPLKICFILAAFHLLFEGIRFVGAGLLVAAGDTTFNMIASAVSVWLFLLLPVYVFVVHGVPSVELAWFITVIYGALSSVVFLGRFLLGRWKKIDLLSDPS